MHIFYESNVSQYNYDVIWSGKALHWSVCLRGLVRLTHDSPDNIHLMVQCSLQHQKCYSLPDIIIYVFHVYVVYIEGLDFIQFKGHCYN